METNVESFRQLGIAEPILKAIIEEKFETPTEIQVKSIPLILSGKDVIAASATGSGKTLAFGSGIIQALEKGKGVRALVVTPTRELADQVAGALVKFSRYNPLKIAVIYGGVGMGFQLENLRHADVVVGTPGRLMDHIRRGSLKLGKIRTMIMDEADLMLDMGFIEDIKKILKECPAERQTLLFSATISSDIAKLAQRYMKSPVEVSAVSQVDPSKLMQVYYDVADDMKFSVLAHLLKNETSDLAMVFCNTKRSVDFVAKNLNRNGIDASAIHGGYSQAQRNHTLSQFHNKRAQIMVCTDVAARGLDIKGVSHVYNYDIPRESKQYIHRIGRTARAGNDGKAVSILSPRDYGNFDAILRYQRVKIAQETTPQVTKLEASKGGGKVLFGRDRRECNCGGQGHGQHQHGGHECACENHGEGQQGQSRGFGGPRRSYGGQGHGGSRGGQGRPGGYGQGRSGGFGGRSGGYGGRSGGRFGGNREGGYSQGNRSGASSQGKPGEGQREPPMIIKRNGRVVRVKRRY
ncbi:MAG: DEAD/DEAH box helicase [Candidatus Thermoplasmatota archaeon]|nr:DEAD/DEAH box helicase [Candidatus Thermoplasmatota archaeon]